MFLEDDSFPEPISLYHRYIGDYYQTYDIFDPRIDFFPFRPGLPNISYIQWVPDTRFYLQRIRPLHYNTEFDYLMKYREYLFSIVDKMPRYKIIENRGLVTRPDPDPTAPIGSTIEVFVNQDFRMFTPPSDYKLDPVDWDGKLTLDRDTAVHYIILHHGSFFGWHRQPMSKGVNRLSNTILNNSLIVEDPEAIVETSNPEVDRWLFTSTFNLPTFDDFSQPTFDITVTSGPGLEITEEDHRFIFNVDPSVEFRRPESKYLDVNIIRGTNNKYGQPVLENVGEPPIFILPDPQFDPSDPRGKLAPSPFKFFEYVNPIWQQKLFPNVSIIYDPEEIENVVVKYPFKVESSDPNYGQFHRFYVNTNVNVFSLLGSGLINSNSRSGLENETVRSGLMARSNLRFPDPLYRPISPSVRTQVFTTIDNRKVLLEYYLYGVVSRKRLVPREPGNIVRVITDLNFFDEYWLKLDDEDPLSLEYVDMPDSPRIMELHAALRADLFGQTVTDEESGNSIPRITNLAWYIVSLCKVFGINYDKDGKNQMVQVRSGGITERRPIQVVSGTTDDPTVQTATIEGILPFGCVGFTNENLETGLLSNVPPDSVNSYPQWVYKVKSNQFVETEFGSTEIQSGDYVICYTMQQFLQTIMQDLDKALGMASAGANAIPNADGSEKICTYEGLGTLLAENAYMLSSLSRQSSQNLVSSLITQGLGLELLKATGYPLEFGEIKARVAGLEDVSIPYPKLAPTSPTVNSQVMDILNNLGPLIANLLCSTQPEEDTNT